MTNIGSWRPATADEVMDAAHAHLREQRVWRVVRYPHRDLDRVLGPMVPGELVTITSDRGGGRSTLAHDIARSAALAQDRSVLLVTGDLTPAVVGTRLLAAEARVSRAHLRWDETHQRDDERLATAEAAIRASRLLMLDGVLSSSALFDAAFRAWCSDDIDILVVDDAHLMTPAEHDQRSVLPSMRHVAEQLRIPVVATGAIGRSEPSDGPPTEREVWGPAGEDRVNVSISIHRPDLYGSSAYPGEAHLTIRRSGVEPARVDLSFQGHYSRFTDMAPVVRPD